MDVTERDVSNLERIAEEVFGDTEYLEIEEVKDTKGDEELVAYDTRLDAVQWRAPLAEIHDVSVAVGGGNESHSARFERAEDVEFGSTDPEGTYELKDDWSATVGDNLVVRKDGDVVAHIERDGWRLDRYPLYRVLPSHVGNALEDHGFEESDDVGVEI